MRRRLDRLAVALVSSLTAPVAASTVSNVHVPPSGAVLIEAAVRGGARRLARPECARVLTDFRDASGRTLAESARSRGLTPSESVASVFFYGPAEEGGACGRGYLLAYTSPGSRVVRVCPQLADVSRRDRIDAELVIIHEVLHALGLGENPPAPSEIAAVVADRCGDD